MTSESDEYLPDDDSEDSLNEDQDGRPNRWHGLGSTWQLLNHEEIDTLTALNKIRDGDLSIHLYNAFALKQRHKRAQNGVVSDGPVSNKVNALKRPMPNYIGTYL